MQFAVETRDRGVAWLPKPLFEELEDMSNTWKTQIIVFTAAVLVGASIAQSAEEKSDEDTKNKHLISVYVSGVG